MRQPSPYTRRLSEILAPYCGKVEEKLRDLASRRYPASVECVSLELRGYFPDAFPFIVYFWDSRNSQVFAPEIPEGFELVVDPFELDDADSVEDELQALLDGFDKPDEVEALEWHHWLRERWIAAGVAECSVRIVADSYYTNLRTDLRSGATCRT